MSNVIINYHLNNQLITTLSKLNTYLNVNRLIS